jgi:hypothetical protein
MNTGRMDSMSPWCDHIVTVGDMVNRILDLEQALQDVMDLIHELSGPDSDKSEVVQRARKTLNRKVGEYESNTK